MSIVKALVDSRSAARPGAVKGRTIGVAVYGMGTVGSGLARVIQRRRADLSAGCGLSLALRHVAVRDPLREREISLDAELYTTDLARPLADPSVDIVVEVMGDLEPARSVVCAALITGKHVVTANKALLATHGAELEAVAARSGTILRYEAAVGGAIPVLHALRGALVGNRIRRIAGIINGTTNYILTRMSEDRLTFDGALARAQQLGFAEADPTADITGRDAAQKLVILARHAFGRWLPIDTVQRAGIDDLTLAQIVAAHREGCNIKLIAEATRDDRDNVALKVGPVKLPFNAPLAGVCDEVNAIVLEGDFSGPLLLQGRGAGGDPTASAVYADLVELALAAMREPRV